VVEVKSDVRARRVGAWTPAEAYALVADVPLSASHYPGLQRLEDLGEGAYRWHLSRYEAAGHQLDVGYTAHYTSDPAKRRVQWRSQRGPGDNVAADGAWQVGPQGQGAYLDFDIALWAKVPVPRLAGPLARRTVSAIFRRQIQTYLGAIATRMGGTVER
jgi:hypothetical protein